MDDLTINVKILILKLMKIKCEKAYGKKIMWYATLIFKRYNINIAINSKIEL